MGNNEGNGLQGSILVYSACFGGEWLCSPCLQRGMLPWTWTHVLCLRQWHTRYLLWLPPHITSALDVFVCTSKAFHCIISPCVAWYFDALFPIKLSLQVYTSGSMLKCSASLGFSPNCIILCRVQRTGSAHRNLSPQSHRQITVQSGM